MRLGAVVNYVAAGLMGFGLQGLGFMLYGVRDFNAEAFAWLLIGGSLAYLPLAIVAIVREADHAQ